MIDPLLYFRNVYVQLGGGGWLRFVDAATRATPVAEVNVVQTDSEQAFAAEGDPLEVAPLRRGSSHGRVAFQVVGGRLCVCLADGLFRYGRFEVRATPGHEPEFAGDVAPHDPEDRLLVAADEIVPSPRPADADGDRLPDGWAIEGAAARVETTADGVAVEAGDAACSLELAVPFAGDAPVVAFSRIRVDAGRVRFGVRVRRESAASVAEPGPPVLVSSVVTPGKRPPILVRFDLEPRTRCAIEWVSLRRALRLGDVLRGA
jgi:hypothetical protein